MKFKNRYVLGEGIPSLSVWSVGIYNKIEDAYLQKELDWPQGINKRNLYKCPKYRLVLEKVEKGE